MKKLLLILFLFCASFVQAQNPVTITQPYKFLKYVQAKDSLHVYGVLFINLHDTASTMAYARLQRAGLIQIKDSGTVYLTPHQATVLISGKVNVVDTLNMLSKYKADINTRLRSADIANKADLVGGKVPLSQMNAGLLGAVRYQSTWNASTNAPNLPSADTTKGWYYIVSTSGTQYGLTYGIGDWIISNGVAWGRVKTTAYSIMYEISVSTSGVTTFMIPFPLTDISNVFYNGYSISSAIWSGVGTTSITLNADTRVYDIIKIQN